MAYFAKIGANNIVLEVLAVADEDCFDADRNESEEVGRKFLEKLTGYPIWKKTSFNNNIRTRYAGIGYTYDEFLDAFIPPQPYRSWILNTTTKCYEPPVALPKDGMQYVWDEEQKNWVSTGILVPDQPNN
jgi:hypothetical protein